MGSCDRQLGNFAIAGHRVTAGNPFWSLPSLKDGDLVYIETRLNNYTYRSGFNG